MLAEALAEQPRDFGGPGRRSRWLHRLLPLGTLAASRGSAIVAQFAAQLVVGMSAGAAGLGILQLFTSWTCIAGELLGLGWPGRAMRQVAVDYAAGRGALVEGVLRGARRNILQAWLLLVLAGIPLLLLWLVQAGPVSGEYGRLILAVFLTAPLFALLRLYADSLKAAGAALPAVTLESLTSPLALLLVCGACWLAGQKVAAVTLVATFGVSLALTTLALRHSLRRQLSRLVQREDNPGSPAATAPRGDLFYLWGTGVLSIAFVHLPFLVMPLYVDPAEIGVFAVAHKLINIVTTLLLILAAVYGPAFARCAAHRDRAALRALLRRTQLISTAVFFPAALALVALSPYLARLFGEDFGDLQIFLCLLAAGHLVNAATGLSGVLLAMAGLASREATSLLITLIITLALSLWVGPRYGATGLAMVFSGSIALKNIASWLLARQFLNSAGERP